MPSCSHPSGEPHRRTLVILQAASGKAQAREAVPFEIEPIAAVFFVVAKPFSCR